MARPCASLDLAWPIVTVQALIPGTLAERDDGAQGKAPQTGKNLPFGCRCVWGGGVEVSDRGS